MAKLELLAPARDAEVAIQALLHGADAVYMGATSHGARAAAANGVADIARVCDFAHRFDARVYVTVNTLVYDSELRQVEALVRDLYHAGVDALIVQDMALLRLDLPPIALHASTQCDMRTPQKAAFLADLGFSQLVLPREFSIHEIEQVRRAVPADVALEAFVHGALCVSYSGDCQAGYVACGRSANRGECPQMCRMAYDLVDASGRILIEQKHLLSLRDLNRLADLGALAAAGVASFKIEGRLKDAAYVKTVVAAYRKALDAVIASAPDRYSRASLGDCRYGFEPDVRNAFNRGFTPYFLSAPVHTGPAPTLQGVRMANHSTPKWVGRKVGVVVGRKGGAIEAKLTAKLANGDGLGFFGTDGRFTGFRANRVEGNLIYPADEVQVHPGAQLFRNSDSALNAALARDTAWRTMAVDMRLRAIPGERLALDMTLAEDRQVRITATADCSLQQAKAPQAAQRRQALSKLGDTLLRLSSLDDCLDDMAFVPLSTLSALRREACRQMQDAICVRHRYELRRPEKAEASCPEPVLTYHDNVANSLARRVYESHGATVREMALEAQPREAVRDGAEPRQVMCTRYCLRRELGACLLTPQGKCLPSPLYIQNRAARYRLDFDCRNCRMRLLTP